MIRAGSTSIGGRLTPNHLLIARVSTAAALLAYGLLVDPDTGHGGIPCLWRTFFGLECAGCGLSRAGALLVRGHLHAAARANWLIFPFAWFAACKAIGLHFPSVVNNWRIQPWRN